MILLGRSGTSRTSAFKAYIAERNCIGMERYEPFRTGDDYVKWCGCLNCTKIRNHGQSVGGEADKRTLKVQDIHIIGSDPSLGARERLRDAVSGFSETSPQELDKRYLIVRGADGYPRGTLDTLLKLLEESPDYLEIFLTARIREDIPPAIVSRCEVVIGADMTSGFLSNLVQRIPTLAALKSKASAYPFRSISELRLYSKLDLELQFKNLFVSATSPFSLELAAGELWDKMDVEGESIPIDEVRSFVLRFFHDSLQEYIRINASTSRQVDQFRLFAEENISHIQDRLFEYAESRRGNQWLNLRRQFELWLLCLYIIRKSLELI
jgi:hypothetical protein